MKTYYHPTAIIETGEIGVRTRIWAFAHVLEGAVVGRDCNIGDHCYIESRVHVGDEVVLKNGVSLWSGIVLEDRVFIGPNVAFTNDRFPRANVYRESYDPVLIKEGASVGANSTLIGPITVGRYALIGAGSVVAQEVPDFGLAFGNPCRLKGFVSQCGLRLPFAVQENGVTTCQCGRKYKKTGTVVEIL